MSRITENTGTLITEVVAPRTVLRWDRKTNGGTVEFHTVEVMSLNGDELKETMGPILVRNLEDVLMREFPAEVGTDAEGNPTIVMVSGGLLMAGLKGAFEVLWNEYLNPPAPVEPTEPEEGMP